MTDENTIQLTIQPELDLGHHLDGLMDGIQMMIEINQN